MPDQAVLADPLAKVPMSVRFDVGFAAQIFADAKAGVISTESAEYRMGLGILEQLKARGLEAERLLEAFTERDAVLEARKSATVPDVDGQLVRIAGYALPLSETDAGVRTFLLVPYVGACIHYPPPPANQMVLARLAEPHQFRSRYAPVWITGRLIAQDATQSLNYVDGAARVRTSYSMDVLSLTPYAEDPSAQITMGSFSAETQGPQLRLSRSGLPHPPLEGGTQ